MSVCWKPEWCECPDCGPLVKVHPCGHISTLDGCGGCDPGAIDYEFGGAS